MVRYSCAAVSAEGLHFSAFMQKKFRYRSVAAYSQLVLLIIFTAQYEGIEYYVKPTDSRNVSCPLSQPCLTINQYTDPSNNYLELNNTVFTFLPGEHFMERSMKFNNVENITIQAMEDRAYSQLLPRYMCHLRNLSAPFIDPTILLLPYCPTIQMKEVVNVSISGLTMVTAVNISGIFIENSIDVDIQQNIIYPSDELMNSKCNGVGIFVSGSIHINIASIQTGYFLYGIVIWQVNDVMVQNSLFQEFIYTGLCMIETNHINLLNLFLNASGKDGLILSSTRYSSLENVHVTLSGSSGLSFYNCTKTKMMKVSSINNHNMGIYLESSVDTTMINTSSWNNLYSGIYVFNSSGTTITNISTLTNEDHGIYVMQSIATTMINATSMSNLGDGIHIEYSTEIMMINISLNNQNSSINMYGCADSTINDISSINSLVHAIYLEKCTNTTIINISSI